MWRVTTVKTTSPAGQATMTGSTVLVDAEGTPACARPETASVAANRMVDCSRERFIGDLRTRSDIGSIPSASAPVPGIPKNNTAPGARLPGAVDDQLCGRMFWFIRNKLFGSYLALIFASRS